MMRYNLQSGIWWMPNGFQINYTTGVGQPGHPNVAFGDAGSQTATYSSNGQRVHTVDHNGIEVGTEFDPATGFVVSQASGGITYTYGYDGSYASPCGGGVNRAAARHRKPLPTNNQLQQVKWVRATWSP